jgi:type IX secretion system PorP/SprF family membrane protein
MSYKNMKYKYSTLLLMLILLTKSVIYAQQQPLYSQFTYNKYLFNPAVAGSDHVGTLHLSAYEQWIGFAGAPKFHTASFDTRFFQEVRKPRRSILKKLKIFKPENVGGGVQFFTEKYGPLSHTGLVGSYTYHLAMEKQQLSFGLSSTFSNLGLKSSDILLSDEQTDLLVLGENTRRWILDFDFGIFLRSKEYFAGYSIHHLSRSAIQWGGSIESDYRQGRIHYLMAGYKYEISSKLSLEPSTLIKLSEKQKDQIDLSMVCTISTNYWCGMAYKTSNILSVFGGFKYDRYMICYAFDYSLNPIRSYSLGSHEIQIAIQFGDETSRYKWLNTY